MLQLRSLKDGGNNFDRFNDAQCFILLDWCMFRASIGIQRDSYSGSGVEDNLTYQACITGRKLSQGLARTNQMIERLRRIVMVVHRKALIDNLSENFLVQEFL